MHTEKESVTKAHFKDLITVIKNEGLLRAFKYDWDATVYRCRYMLQQCSYYGLPQIKLPDIPLSLTN